MKQITFGELARSINDEQLVVIFRSDMYRKTEAWCGQFETMPAGYLIRYIDLKVYDIKARDNVLEIELMTESEGDE